MNKSANVFIVLMLQILDFVNGQTANQKQGTRQVKLLFSIIEYGTRAPIKLIPGDPNNKQWEKTGVGQLTYLGKQEQLQNGQMTKTVYNKFFGSLYNSSQFFIQSCSIDQCVTSGQLFTTGLFPPKTDEVWKDCRLAREWQPIPVYTTNIACQTELIHEGINLMKKALGNTTIYNKHRNVLNTISKGVKALLSNTTAIYNALDALMCEAYGNFSMPFGLAIYKDKLIPLMNDVMNYAVSQLKPKIAAIILNDMVRRVRMFNNGSSLVKANTYILTEIHIATLMFVLTNSPVGFPSFSSSIFIELHKPDDTIDTEYFMLFYRPRIQIQATAYNIKNCGFKCKYADFIKLVNQIKSNSNL